MLVEIPFAPGVQRNRPDFSNAPYWVDANHARWRDGCPEPIGGWTPYVSGTVSGKARGMLLWYDAKAEPHVAIGTHTHLYAVRGGQVLDITPDALAPGFEYAGGSGSGGGWGIGPWGVSGWSEPVAAVDFVARIWSLSAWGNWLLASPRGGRLYQWDGTPDARAEPVPGAPTAINCMLVTPERFAVAFGCSGLDGNYDPLLVRWCSQEDLTDWSPSSLDLSGDYRLSVGSSIVGARLSKSQVLVWTDSALYGMRYLGDVEFVHGFDLLGPSCGLIGPNAAVEHNGTAFWMGANTFYVYDGSAPRTLPCPVSDFVFGNLKSAQADLIVSGLNPGHSEVWWFYPDGAGEDGAEVNRYVVYNYVDNTWTIGELARTCWISGDNLGTPLAVSPQGVVYAHEVPAAPPDLAPWVESSPFGVKDGDQVFNISRVVPDLRVTGSVNITLKTRRWPQGEMEFTKTSPFGPASTKIDTRAQGRQAQLRFESADPTTRWRLGKVRLDIADGGKR